MRKMLSRIIFMLLITAAVSEVAMAQPGGALRRLPGGGGSRGGGGATRSKDSLEKRNSMADSITINFRYIDSTRFQKFDSSITDFTQRFPVPWYHYHLGNVGSATRSLIFQPIMQPGWDHGFHAYDVYNLNDYETR